MLTVQSPEKEERAALVNAMPSGRLPIWQSTAIYSLLVFAFINILTASLFPPKKQELTRTEILSSHNEALHQGPWSWWLARAVLLNRPADVVLMGDSQINAAVFQADAFSCNRAMDCAADRQVVTLERLLSSIALRTPEVINLAMGGAVASDQYLISKALLEKAVPKIVVVGVSPRCFLDNSLPAPSATDPFQFFEPYVELGPLAHLAFPDLMGEASWRFKHYLPLLEVRDQVFKGARKNSQVANHPSEASLGKERSTVPPKMLSSIYGSASDVKKGEMLVPPVIVPGFYDNSLEYRHRYKDRAFPGYKVQRQFFDAYLNTLTGLGVKVAVVGMPCTALNRKLLPAEFWSDYRSWLNSECRNYGAVWCDLSDDPAFAQNFFLDTVHLNAFGARLLIQKIAALLATNSSLSKYLSSDNCQSQVNPTSLANTAKVRKI